MKFLMITSLCLFSFNAFSNEKNKGMSEHHEEMMKKMDKMSYEDAKKWHIEMLDKKTSMIDEERKCINDSKDKAGLKDCMKKMHNKMEDMMDKKEKMK